VGTPEAERRRIRGRRLTDRQTEVLELVAEGLENKEIGHRIGLSEQAVKEHVSALLRRLAVRNRAALAEIATELKIAGTMALPQEWLGFIFEQSPVASAVVRGPDLIYVAANNAYRRAAGSDDIIGRRLVDVFPHVSAHTLAMLAEVLVTGRTRLVHEMPGRWIRGGKLEDGFVDVLWQPLPGIEGGIIISGVDVTDEVRARQSLAELSVERLALFDLVPSPIVVLDGGGAVVKVNRAAQSLLGGGPYGDVSPASAKPYQLRDAATGRDLPVEDALTRALRGEPVHDVRIRMFLPALGRDATVRIDAEPLMAGEGKVRGVVAAITELVHDPLVR
jgi:DNA-binding CsgD family transcriptional regulator